jgi:hypothetical protein
MKKKNVELRCKKHIHFTGAHNPGHDCIICWKIRVTYLMSKITQLKDKLNAR